MLDLVEEAARIVMKVLLSLFSVRASEACCLDIDLVLRMKNYRSPRVWGRCRTCPSSYDCKSCI